MSRIRKICFDRILPRNLNLPRPVMSLGPGGRMRAIGVRYNQWINGSHLSITFLGGSSANQQLIRDVAPEWTNHANLHFEFTDSPIADIRIAFADDGAWSYIGTDAKSIAPGEPTMNYGFIDEGTILHEFGHAIGLAHEHSNPDGGIQWNEQAVIDDLTGPPNYWTIEQIRHNVFNKYSAEQIHGTEFDPESIMLYSFPPEWTLDGFHHEPNDDLSEIDKLFVAGKEMYPATVNDVVDIPVSEIASTPAAIGTPGEEDVFRFSANHAGRYTVETEGPTDVMMKLFGPDDQNLLVAEDDDNGQGRNPRIVAYLTPGQYLVQVRHWDRTTGTGDYGIKVYR